MRDGRANRPNGHLGLRGVENVHALLLNPNPTVTGPDGNDKATFVGFAACDRHGMRDEPVKHDDLLPSTQLEARALGLDVEKDGFVELIAYREAIYGLHDPWPLEFVAARTRKAERRPYFLAWPSAKAWSKRRPGDLKLMFSLMNRTASAAPYSRSMPGSSHSTERGPA